MSRVSLVWISKGNSSFRTFSVPKILFQGVGVGLLLLVLTAAGSLWWAGRLHREAARVTELESRLRQEAARADSLQEENRRMGEAFKQIQTTDNKIRRFLGLNEQSYDHERSHQGGMGSPGEVESPHPHAPAAATQSSTSPQSFLEMSDTLQSSLAEVLAHLEERRQESRRMPMILPAASDKVWLSCNFGWREDPFAGNRREFHNGIDIAGPWKTPILAPADGTVLRTGKDRLFGNYVKLKHTGKIKTLYGHLESVAVKTGAKVKRGDVIGYMGNTGRSTGTHLHYSVAVNDKYVDPQDFIWDRPFRSLTL